MDILSSVKNRIKDMDNIDQFMLAGMAIGCLVLFGGVCSTFKEINTKQTTVSSSIESTNTPPVVPLPSPLSSQTIDINVNPDPTTISNSKSNLPFHQEINISGSNATVTINNYDGNVK